MKLSIVNRKGGVGKTTTAINLAAGLAQAHDLGVAERNFRTLLIDLDSQANASTGLRVAADALEPSISSILLDGHSVQGAIRQTHIPNLSLITASDRIAEDEKRFYQHQESAVYRLSQAIALVEKQYDAVIIDLPPALGLVFTMSMIAADLFLVPVTLEHYSVDGIANLFASYAKHRKQYPEHAARLFGLLLTKADYRLVDAEIKEAALRDAYQDAIFQTVIRTNVHIDRAQDADVRQTIFEFAPDSRGAEGYRELTREVIQRARAQGFLGGTR